MKFGNYCLEEAFESPELLVSNFRDALEREGVHEGDFDTLVGTGFSGALVVPILARALGKDFLLVRKPGDSHHHGSAVAEGNLNDSGKWLFVDDGIGTGSTYSRARVAVNRLATRNGLPDKFGGAYLYGHGALHPSTLLTPRELDRQGIHVNFREADDFPAWSDFKGEPTPAKPVLTGHNQRGGWGW